MRRSAAPTPWREPMKPFGYPESAMGTVLGLLGLVVFAACVIALAAGVTWAVVKVIPPSRPGRKETPAS
jgi:hypothetical protein